MIQSSLRSQKVDADKTFETSAKNFETNLQTENFSVT